MVDLFEVIGDPQRRRLLRLLAGGERTVTQLSDQFLVSRSAISQHLLRLLEVGLVTARKEGRNRHYRLEEGGQTKLENLFDSFWNEELDLLIAQADEIYLSNREGEL